MAASIADALAYIAEELAPFHHEGGGFDMFTGLYIVIAIVALGLIGFGIYWLVMRRRYGA